MTRFVFRSRRSSAPIALLTTIALTASGCGGDQPPPAAPLEIHVTASVAAAVRAFAGEVPWPSVSVIDEASLPATLSPTSGLAVAVAADLMDMSGRADCAECFRIDALGGGFVVHGGGPLGAGYGLATLLEAVGFRFHQPLRPAPPATLAATAALSALLGKARAPEKALRGIHLHTLHPIEGYFSHWADGAPGEPANIADARRIHQWLVANRGNYIEWVALADIIKDAARAERWRARTRALIDDAHARGLKVGLGVQLFRASDLQLGFDLIDTLPAKLGDDAAIAAEIDKRITLLAGLGVDTLNVSFGEFSAFDPAVFVRALDVAAKEIRDRLGAQVTTTVHVGGLPSQRVDFMGENLPYYFLVKFADPAIEPWVHSVMFYNLFEDAGGSYDMDNYDEHRAFLTDRLKAKRPVAYFPETAYWITFDVSVPLYLPLYVRSRFHDMHQLRAAAKAGGFDDLSRHVQFSSGFEWGYWQQDRATLRMGYQLPERWEDVFTELLPAPLAADIVALTTAQHDALIVQRLAPYFAARDSYIDLGTKVGIHSQPDRPSFAEVAGWDAAKRAAWRTSVLEPLGAYAGQLATLAVAAAQHADRGDPDQAEVADGIAIDAARARFIHALFAAALGKAGGADPTSLRAEASAAFAEARAVVTRRHATVSPSLREGTSNVTIYPFGYLAQAETLCYWEREQIQLGNLLDGRDEMVPGCIF